MFVGLVLNLSTGTLIIIGYSKLYSHKFENWVEAINVLPCIISLVFMGDAMRRLKKIVVRSKLLIDTWQFFWHMVSYSMLAVSAILLEVASRNSWDHASVFFWVYGGFVVALFMSQMPFVYIINRLVS